MDYKSVMTKIESKFFKRTNPNYYFNGWLERFQDFKESSFEGTPFEVIGNNLLEGEKYWWIYVDAPCNANSRHRFFDATIIGGEALSYIFSESPIYIVHKKYEWMLMIDRKEKTIKKKTNKYK